MAKIIRYLKKYHVHISCLWLCCVLLMGAYCINSLFLTSDRLQHNILSLLPTHDHMENMSQSLSGKMIILLKHEDPVVAKMALNKIRTLIKEKKLPIIEQNYEFTAEQYKNFFKAIYPYRAGFLSDKDRNLLINHQKKQIADQATLEAVNPFSTLGPANLQQDPFYLFPRFVISLKDNVAIENDGNGNLFITNKEEVWTFFQGNLTNSAFSFETQNSISDHLIPLLDDFEHKGIQVSTVGAIFHAMAGAKQASKEVSHIGILSLLGIIGLLWLVFRTLALFRIVTVVMLTSVIVGISSALIIFQKIHILSLVFGSSLLGVSVDYAIHYYCKTYQCDEDKHSRDFFTILRQLTPALPLAVLSSCLGYVLLVCIPFPGVQQMAIITTAGLLSAFISIYLWGPYLVRTKNRELSHLGKKINAVLQDMVNFSHRFNFNKLLIIAMMSVFSVGIVKLHFEDRLQYFQPVNERLKKDEALLKSLISFDNSFQYLSIQHQSLEVMLQKIESIIPELEELKLKKEISGYRSITSLLPSQKRQEENKYLLKTLYQEHLKDFLNKLNIVEHSDVSFLALNAPLLSFVPALPEGWRDLIDEKENMITAKLFLMNVQDSKTIETFVGKNPGIKYVNPIGEYSELFSLYRNIIMAAIVLVLSMVVVFISLYNNLKMMIKIMSPIVLSMMFTLGLISCLGFPLTLFHMLGLMLVQCLGIDYAFFLYWEDKSNFLANALTALTTILSFGFLIFSSSIAVHDFGMAVFIGILTCFFSTTFFLGKPQCAKLSL